MQVLTSIWPVSHFWIVSKHFKSPMIKMYDTINDIIGESRIDLSYLIKNFDSSKEITIVGVFNDKIQYEFIKP